MDARQVTSFAHAAAWNLGKLDDTLGLPNATTGDLGGPLALAPELPASPHGNKPGVH